MMERMFATCQAGELPELPQNFADPGGGVCLKTIPTGGNDDKRATCVETDLTQRGVVASQQI
jgi:hypothetical protein